MASGGAPAGRATPAGGDATRSRWPVDVRPSPAPLSGARRRKLLTDPPFGEVFTDHMVTVRWSPADGWHGAVLEPFGPLELSPATVALHYGQSVFEGFKAYRRGPDGAAVFRLADHSLRLNDSARRLAAPEVPTGLFTASVEALVRQDMDWVPEGEDRALYLRPVLFASEAHLALRPARAYLLTVIAFPTGAFFGSVARPVTVAVSEEYVRAAPGGTGDAKFGGNYAGAYAAQGRASLLGADQVVWLDAVERRWVEELGGMNLFFVHGEGDRVRLTTPPLSGTILPGVTRDTLITLARELGLEVAESRTSLDDWREGCHTGRITEVFACGTAAVATPVGTVLGPDGGFTVGDGSPGPVTARLSSALRALHRGTAPDPHGWFHQVRR